MDCVFCSVIKGELPSYKVYEDDFAFAFLDINPITKGHTLVLPKAHVNKFTELKNTYLTGFVLAVQRVMNGIDDSIMPQGLNIVVNQGEAAGQVIPHLHFHIVPRNSGDGVKFASSKVDLDEEEFRALSTRISSAIKV